ncbi:unnamed protein product [marine sediment metagenome]|uniref:Uncharacterized protein n=1 Tax=marine sediment metagenome TaxID=412755 RepID=X0ZFX8_9ZZZZ
MALVKLRSNQTTDGTSWMYITGTIASCLDTIAAESASAMTVPFWSDDATDAKVLICRQQ